MSSKDLKIRSSQFCRMNCQIFLAVEFGSTGGSCKSEMLLGTLGLGAHATRLTERYSRMIRSRARQRTTPWIAGRSDFPYDSGEKGLELGRHSRRRNIDETVRSLLVEPTADAWSTVSIHRRPHHSSLLAFGKTVLYRRGPPAEPLAAYDGLRYPVFRSSLCRRWGQTRSFGDVGSMSDVI
jgi:hypothetical protein